MRTGDELYLHALRHMVIDQLEVFAVENVLSMKKFPLVMDAMLRLPSYFVQVFCPVNSFIWLPKRRERLFMLGSRCPFAWRPPTARHRVKLAEIVEKEPPLVISEYVANWAERPIARRLNPKIC